jgi:hypothetical protein
MMRIAMIVTVVLSASAAVCHAAGPSIESVVPAVGQRGTDFSLKIVGAGLSDAQDVLLYSPGVRCVELNAVSDNELSVTLHASTECSLGNHPFRVRTPNGITELKLFRVTPFPVVAEVESNDQPSAAMLVTSNVTVSGYLDKNDVDCFKLNLHRGDRLAAEVEAVRLGASLVDTVLTVFGPDGQKITSVDDTSLFGQDPFLSLVADRDGDYCVQVHEVNLEGDENSRYALHLGTFPRPAFVFPAGGPVGKQLKVRFEGDALGPITRQITLPGSSQAEFGLIADDGSMASPTAIPFRLSPFENLIETEPNEDPSLISTAVDLPVSFNGILQEAGDVDCFRFRMKEGERIQFDSFADRIGSPVDTIISILDADGTVLSTNDDYGSHDSRLMFQAARTGDYFFQMTDQRGAGGKNFVYRVEATVPQPALISFLPRPDRMSQERQAISVPRGNRVMTFLAVQRHGVNSEVRLSPQNLPAGINRFFATVPSDCFLVPVVIEAEPDAPIGGNLVRIFASGEADGSTVTGEFEQVVDLVSASADRLYQSISVDRLAIGVIEPAPFSIELVTPKSSLFKDGTIELTINVIRSNDFTDPVDVTFPFLPPWVDGPAKVTVPANEKSGVYLAHAFPQAKARAWQICAEGRAAAASARDSGMMDPAANPPQRRSRRGSKRNDVAVATQLVDFVIADSPLTGTIGKVAGEQNTTIQVVCTIECSGSVPERLEATLEGLPNRVQASPVSITSKASTVTFDIRLDATAPIGEFDSLVCRLTGQIEGQTVSYCVGRGGILKITPPGGLMTDEAGRPLSPLEVLRKSQRSRVPEKPVNIQTKASQ